MEWVFTDEVTLLDMESVAIEDREDTIADVRGEDVEPGALRELEQPAVAVEEVSVVPLEDRVRGEPGGGPADEPGGGAERKEEGQPTDNVVADVELDEANHLGGSLGEL